MKLPYSIQYKTKVSKLTTSATYKSDSEQLQKKREDSRTIRRIQADSRWKPLTRHRARTCYA